MAPMRTPMTPMSFVASPSPARMQHCERPRNRHGSYVPIMSRIPNLRKGKYWDTVVKTFHFGTHFLSVMILLYMGAMVFALLEDPELYSTASKEDRTPESAQINDTSNFTHTIDEVMKFWEELEKDYEIHCINDTRGELMQEIYEFVLRGVKQKASTSASKRIDTNIYDRNLNESVVHKEVNELVVQSNLTGHTDREILIFWQSIETKYNITINDHQYINVLKDVKEFISGGLKRHFHTSATIFLKWFYFVTTSVTTIGYGQVYPKTDNGRLFYIFFSVLGISLMMTLLKEIGDVLSKANKRFYSFNRWYFGICSKISDELLSFISLLILFLIYMIFVVWHDKGIAGANSHNLIMELYYWVVTFTTVGFGDVIYPLEVEIHHVYGLLCYRLLGLTFLAAIIDALQKYLKYRKKIIVKSTKQGMRRASRVVQRLAKDVLAGALQPNVTEQMNALEEKVT